MKTVFNFLRIGYGVPLELSWNRESRDPYNRLHIPLSGSAVITMGDEEYTLEAGHIYFLPSHVDMYMKKNGVEKYEHIYIDAYVSPVVAIKEPVVIKLDNEHILEGFKNQLYQLMQNEGHGEYIQFETVRIPRYLEYYSRALLLFIFEQYGIKQLDNTRLAKALTYIYSHYTEDISNEDIAASIYVHSRHLTRLFKSEINMTPHQCLTEYRINMAINLLEEGHEIKDVCYRCGFKDISTFGTAFKRMNGLSPSVYRETILKSNAQNQKKESDEK